MNLEEQPEWKKKVKAIALGFAMNIEREYIRITELARKQSPLPETPSPDTTSFIINTCMDNMVGAVVIIIAKQCNTASFELEENVIKRVRDKFKVIRGAEAQAQSGLSVVSNGGRHEPT